MTRTTTDAIREALCRPKWTVRRAGSARPGKFGRGWFAEYIAPGRLAYTASTSAWFPTWAEAIRFVDGQTRIEPTC
ncbi:hypothetical protein KXS11_03395 [Plantibacter flavus]|uniref:hypothetical protein n=1 Tax=Plantibacter flavus TaxID=150123 RepID=UPI003F1928A2